MFKTQAAVFYWDLKRRVVLDLIKHVLQVFQTASKTFLEKCVSIVRVHNNDAFVNIGNEHTRKTFI